jgi:hypothetical protein
MIKLCASLFAVLYAAQPNIDVQAYRARRRCCDVYQLLQCCRLVWSHP